jgi:hypothetical protein
MELGHTYYDLGQLPAALTAMEASMAAARRTQFVFPLVRVGTDLALLYAYIGQPTRALAEAHAAYELAQTHLQSFMPRTFLICWRLEWQLHGLAAAEQWRAQAALDLSGNPNAQAWFAWAHNDFENAVVFSAQYVDSVRQSRQRYVFCDALLLLAQAHHRAGQAAAARAVFQELADFCESHEARRAQWLGLAAWAALEEAEGNLAQAQRLRQQAHTILLKIVAPCPPEWRDALLQRPEAHALLNTEERT